MDLKLGMKIWGQFMGKWYPARIVDVPEGTRTVKVQYFGYENTSLLTEDKIKPYAPNAAKFKEQQFPERFRQPFAAAVEEAEKYDDSQAGYFYCDLCTVGFKTQKALHGHMARCGRKLKSQEKKFRRKKYSRNAGCPIEKRGADLSGDLYADFERYSISVFDGFLTKENVTIKRAEFEGCNQILKKIESCEIPDDDCFLKQLVLFRLN